MRRMREHIAYVRRSARSRSDPGDLSREFHTAKVLELAGADAGRVRIVDDDWGRSAATDKTDQRVAFLAILEAVERGEVEALYAYAMDRLARSVEWSARLLNACRRNGTVIVTSEGRFEPDNDLSDNLFYFQAITNENYSKQAGKKRRATVDAQRKRYRESGDPRDKLGPAFYGDRAGEDRAAVVAAFDEAGSAHRAARLLNERLLSDPKHAARPRRAATWTHATVRQVVAREGRVYPHGARGAKLAGTFTLSRLLLCWCGNRLTGVRHPRSGVIYRCVSGQTDPRHRPGSIAETRVLPFVRAEVAMLRTPGAVLTGEDAAARREQLAEDERRVTNAYRLGAYTDDEFEREILAIRKAEDALDTTPRIVPAVDWEWPVATLNGVLRNIFEYIELGPDLLPVRAAWTVPEWRDAQSLEPA
jgi:DNA invertase Pin-like site-specific DNA recombinase